MSDIEIRKVQEGVIETLKADPSQGYGTGVLEASISDGMVCEVSDGTTSTVIDMPETFGGTAKGPTPGFHARAAVAACVAIGIKSTAVRSGLVLDEIYVRVEMDFDDGAVFELGDNTAAPTKTRIVIDLKTNHSHEEVAPVIDRALEADPFFLALRDPQKVETDLRIV